MAQALRHREETINTTLAILLSKHGIAAESETIHSSGKNRPDVMFVLGGLRVIIEGKFSDTANADDVVSSDARKRLVDGLCHIAVALVYPKGLRTVPSAKLEVELSKTRVKYQILSEAGQTDWTETAPTDILSALRRVHEALIKDDIVAESAKKLSERIEGISSLWTGQGATCDRLCDVLGMPIKKTEKTAEKEARRTTATKVAALVLANAMIFQEQLASSGGDGRIDSLRSYEFSSDPITSIRRHWNWIWTKIDYVPIFQIGEKILAEIPASQPAAVSIRWLMNEAKDICANQSALRHDLMGRIYHWLLHHSKYLGTYYTATSSATILLKLTFGLPWQGVDFGSPKQLANFAVADLACGTGTLLMASAQAITDQFILSRVATQRQLEETDMRHLHEALMENVLFGYDVLPSAVHLTASTLGMLAPGVTYRKMNLFVMPMGIEKRTVRLGSLDFIDSGKVSTQFSLDRGQMEVRQTGISGEHYTNAEVPKLNLCVMNPPFVRSVGGNLLFGSLPDDERAKLQTELKKLSKPLKASITAGLGSVFLALGDKQLKVGGRLAFLLPVALATGEAWGESRKLLSSGYHVEYVIVSHDSERQNFSENTKLSEMMLIARKLKHNETPGNTFYINLWHNPRTIYEAMDVAERVRGAIPALIGGEAISSMVGLDGRKLAEAIAIPPSTGEAQWIGVQFAQTMTIRAAVALQQGELWVPGHGTAKLPLVPLRKFGKLGPDQKRIHEGFKVSETDWSPYPAFWNHDARRVRTIQQKHNSYLTPWQESPRGPDYGQRRLWPRAGRILLIERVRTTTHRLLAVGFDDLILGNTWWAYNTDLSVPYEKALLLWLNSTAAIMLMLSRRVTTQGAWMKIKQPAWAEMPVLDVRSLSEGAVDQLANAYDRISSKELQAIAKLEADPVRGEIDQALSVALDLPNMRSLRELLGREPGLTGKSLSHRPGQIDLLPKQKEELDQQMVLRFV